MMNNSGFTLQSAAQDVLLRRWCVYRHKHPRYRKVTPAKLVASILAIGGVFDFFPKPFPSVEVSLPIEHEHLRYAVEHHWRKVAKQVERDGRRFTLIFPTPPKLEALQRSVIWPVKVCPICSKFTMVRLGDEWHCDWCYPREGTRPIAPPPMPEKRRRKRPEVQLEPEPEAEAVDFEVSYA